MPNLTSHELVQLVALIGVLILLLYNFKGRPWLAHQQWMICYRIFC